MHVCIRNDSHSSTYSVIQDGIQWKVTDRELSNREEHGTSNDVQPVHHRSAVSRRGSLCLLLSVYGQVRGRDEDSVPVG
jgi:hypothetical protein